MHGTTVIASFKQEVERSDQHMRDLISHLNGEGGATGAVSGADNSTELSALTAGEPLEKSEANSLLTESGIAEESSGNMTALVTSSAYLEVTAEGKTQSMGNGTIKAIDNKNSSENGSNQANLSAGSVTVNATAQNSSAVIGLVVGKASETIATATATAAAAAGAGDKKNVLTPLPDDGTSPPTEKDRVIESTASTSVDAPETSKKPLTATVASQNLNSTHNNTLDHVSRNETQNPIISTVTTGVTAGAQDNKNQHIEVSVTGNTEQKKDTAISNSSQSITVTSEGDDEKATLTTKSPSSPSSPSSTSSKSNVSISVKSTSTSTLQHDSDKTKTASGKDKIKHDDIQDDTDMKSNDTSTDITTTQPDLKVESKILNSAVKLSISSDVNATVTVSVLIKKQDNALGDKKVNVIPTAVALKGSDNDSISSIDQLQNKTAIIVLDDTTLNNMTDAAAAAVNQGSDLKKNTSNDTVDATVLKATHTSTSTNTSLTLSNTSEVPQVAADKLKSQQNEVKSTATNDTSAGISGATNATESTMEINDDKEDKSDVKVNDKDSTAVSTVPVAGLKDDNTIISTGVAGSNPIASLSALGILESPILPTFLSAPPASVRATTGPTAGFSPQCLETLRFSEFQATMANKLKQRAEADKSQVPIHSQDNVFRQLMLKIKTLEMNYAIIEMYSAQVSLN